MLEEPEQRIAEEIVILMIDIPRGSNEAEIEALSWQCHLEASVMLSSSTAIAFSHSAGDPGELYMLADPHKGGCNTTSAPI